MTITITRERPDTADAIALIDELEATLAPHYPDESRHGYNVDKLIQQGVIFVVARQGDVAVGCGGIQLYGSEYSELKRMYTRPDYRGQGIATKIVQHLETFSQLEGVTVMRLETGIYQVDAMRLYERLGYFKIPPFGDYQPDPNSVFYEKQLGE